MSSQQRKERFEEIERILSKAEREKTANPMAVPSIWSEYAEEFLPSRIYVQSNLFQEIIMAILENTDILAKMFNLKSIDVGFLVEDKGTFFLAYSAVDHSGSVVSHKRELRISASGFLEFSIDAEIIES